MEDAEEEDDDDEAVGAPAAAALPQSGVPAVDGCFLPPLWTCGWKVAAIWAVSSQSACDPDRQTKLMEDAQIRNPLAARCSSIFSLPASLSFARFAWSCSPSCCTARGLCCDQARGARGRARVSCSLCCGQSDDAACRVCSSPAS